MTKYDQLKELLKEQIIQEHVEVANHLMFYEAVEYVESHGINNFLLSLEQIAKKTSHDARALREIDSILSIIEK